tara:strand:- start:1770 stop:2411 length:642 start_codon:yes stop_codon:yes gene_type:complete
MTFNIKKFNEIKEFIKNSNKTAKIIAISKNHSQESVLEAIVSGVRIFGENRVFEAKDKFLNLIPKYPDLELHLTGSLQSNKVKTAVDLFSVFHTVDREKIAKEFSNYREKLNNKKFFIQVNIGKEETKSGIEPKLTKSFVEHCIKDLKLNIVGLMCIPPLEDDPSQHFLTLQKMCSECKLDELSIGMSNDYKAALHYNPSYIRLGTILFGQRL